MAKDLTLRTELHKGDLRKMSQDIKKVGSLQGIDPSTLRKRFRQPLGKIKGDLGEFQKSMEASNARVIAFGASTALIAGVATALKGAAKAAIDVERSLADINVILNASSKSLNTFGQNLFKIAKDTGQSFQVVAEAAGELARQGLGMQDTLQRTSDALILARLSGMDTVDAVESLTAAINSFSKSAINSTEIVNKLANVDAAFAVSSADLAEAIKRVGSSASDAGVSMDQLIAVVTTAQQTTARGGAVIGNSFKTIFTRLQRPAVLQQLESLGVATKDASGNILPLMGVLKGLAGTFDKLEDVQKSQIAELVGGVFQVNVLKAALSDLGQEYSVYGRALETSISSTDEAIRRNEQLNQTLSSLINRTFVNLQNVGAQVGDIGFAPNAKEIMKSLNSGLEGVDLNAGEDMGNKLGKGIIKGLGNFFLGGPGLMLGALGITKLFSNLRTFALDAFKGITGLNQGAKKRADTEARINELLMNDDMLLDKIASDTLSVDEAAKAVLRTYEQHEKVLKRVSDLSRGTASRIGGSLGQGGKASGFIPNFSGEAEERLAMLAAGYNPSDARNASVRKTRIHNGSGGSFSSYVNSKETVRTGTNAQGYKATFVVPPRGSSAYGNYIKNIPNFARTFGPEDFASTPSRDFQDFLNRHDGGKWKLNRPGVSMGASKAAFSLFKGLSPEKQKASRPAHMKYTGPLKTTADVLKKYGVSQMNISAMAFPDVKGKQNKGLLNFVGTPFDANMFDGAFQTAYPSFLKGVGKGSMKANSDKSLVKHFLSNLRTVATDPQGSAQVRGRVHETLASALLVDHTHMGNKLVDVGKGAQIDPTLKPLLSKNFIKGLASGGVELKGGGFRMSNIFGKFGFEGEKHKAFLEDLRRVGVDISPTGPYAETVVRGEKRRAAAGFIPNFSAKSRAMATERSMGGSPEYRDFPFPHVADKKRQRTFGDILRDHPEGLKKAIGNSFAVQGIPNFAKPWKRKPVSTDDDYMGMFGADFKGLFEQIKGKVRGSDAMAAEAEPKAYQDLADKISELEAALTENQKALEDTTSQIKKSNQGEATALNKGASMKTGGGASGTVWKKSSKQYKEAMAMQGDQVRAVRESKANILREKVKQKQMEASSVGRSVRSGMGEKIRGKAFSAAFLLPTVTGPLTEMMTESPVAKKALDDFSTGLSSAATAVTMLPPGVGLAVGGIMAFTSAAGSFTNWFANVGGDLGKRKDELKESLQNMQDASSRFFDVSSKLDSAIKSGAAGDTLTRLGNKLEETLSELDPAQQALLTSSLSLAEKQDAMAKIIDKNGKQLKQMDIAKNIADSINEARGMGVGSFFKGVGNLFGEGGFRAGANDVNAITSQNVKSMTQGIFSTIGSKDMRLMLNSGFGVGGEGGLSKGGFISSLETAGVDSDLIDMLKELNDKGLEDLRQGLVKTTKEAERNAKVAEANVKVQQMYNRLVGEATKAVQSANDHLLDTQKRLVENFVFHRQMSSDKVFNQIDVSISKFDALFGAAAQNLNAFEKADINFRKKRLNAEISFQKQITTNQNAFIQSAAEIAAIDTGVVQAKTDKKVALRRSQKQVDRSLAFTNILEKFDQTQNMEEFNNSIKELLAAQGDNAQKQVDKLDAAFSKLNQTSASQLEEQKKATEIAEKVREIEKSQAELLRGGGVKALLDPNSFVDMRNKLVDAMEDVFLGSGGGGGALGVNDELAGSGFLNILKTLRAQGFDTAAFARNNPGLERQAVAARHGQNLALADDFRVLSHSMGDPSLALLSQQLSDPSLAGKQVGDMIDPGKRLREEQELQKKLLTDQGDIFKTGIDRIEKITDRNLKKQAETFKNLDAAAIDLEAASHALHRIEILRQFDTTAARQRREAAEQKKKDSAEAGVAAAKSVSGEFGDFAGATNPFHMLVRMFTKNKQDTGDKGLKRILAAFGQDTSTSLASWQSADEQLYNRMMDTVVGTEDFMNAFGKISAATKGADVSRIGMEGASSDFVSHLVGELEKRGTLPQGGGTEQLVKDMWDMMFSRANTTGSMGNIVQTLERVAADGTASGKNMLDALKSNRKAWTEEKNATRQERNLQKKGQRATDDSVSDAKLRGIDANVQSKVDTYIDQAARGSFRAGESKSMEEAFDIKINNFSKKFHDVAVIPFVNALKDPLKVNFGEHVIKIDASQALLEGVRMQIANATPAALVEALRQSGMTTDIDVLKKQMDVLKETQSAKVQSKVNMQKPAK